MERGKLFAVIFFLALVSFSLPLWKIDRFSWYRTGARFSRSINSRRDRSFFDCDRRIHIDKHPFCRSAAFVSEFIGTAPNRVAARQKRLPSIARFLESRRNIISGQCVRKRAGVKMLLKCWKMARLSPTMRKVTYGGFYRGWTGISFSERTCGFDVRFWRASQGAR